MSRRKLSTLALALCLSVSAAFATQAAAADFEITAADAVITNKDGSASTQANGHPFQSATTFETNLEPEPGSTAEFPPEIPPRERS